MNTLTVAHYFKSTDDKLALYKSDPEDNSCEHCHEFDELVIVEQGHGLHIINGRPLYIQQGDIFYVQRGDHHFYDELGTLKLINILINPVAEFVFLRHTGSLLQRFSVRDASCYTWLAPEIRMQCNSLIDKIFSAQPLQVEQRESLFFQLVNTLLQAQSDVNHNNTRYKLHKLLNHLQENCFEEYDWNDLAKQFHLTPRTAFRHIKAATGMTPENYIKHLRLVSARVKVRETDMTITEIAFLCGFANSSHFSTLYKKVFSITPSEERKRAEMAG